MKRDDNLYKLGVFVGHNKEQRPFRGSCIFLHIQRDTNASTAGCTSMKEKELLQLMRWLDEKKRPLLLQVPSLYLRGFNDYR